MPQNCCVPGCKKKVYEEDGVKISFHKFPEDRELFRKWIVALRRDVGSRPRPAKVVILRGFSRETGSF